MLLLRRSRRALPAASRALSALPDDAYDAVVVGGGIVGAAVAARVAQAAAPGRRVALLEAAAPRPVEAHLSLEAPDLRVYSLAAATVDVLRSVGVWDRLPARATPTFTDMQVWDATGHGFVRFDAASAGAEELGWVVEHGVLQAALFERLEELQAEGKLRLVCPAKVESLGVPRADPETGFVPLAEVRTAEETLRTRLVVAADGGASATRERWGIPTWGWGYAQHGLVATVATEAPHATAFQRFLPSGPVALLPVRDGLSSVVWSAPAAEVEELRELSPEAFVGRLNEALRAPARATPLEDWLPALPLVGQAARAVEGLGSALLLAGSDGGDAGFALPPEATAAVGRRFAFPLRLAHASSYVGARMALVGDAAHTVHPLAGQGLNLGLGDAAALADALVDAAEHGGDFGDPVVLGGYERERKAANLAMQGVVDGFQKLFSNDVAPLALARNAGMAAVNRLGPLKGKMAGYAMGAGSLGWW